jgi:NAD+ kinase
MHYKNIAVFGKYQDKSVTAHVAELVTFLVEQKINVYLGATTAKTKVLDKLPVQCIADEDLKNRIELGIVLGGDGTLLSVARKLAPLGIPIIGVNLGQLGFLTDVPITSMNQDIIKILRGVHTEEQRMMLLLEVLRDGELVASGHALNDIVISRHNADRLIAWSAQVNGKLVISARSDGVIVSTPTGSTAYALSAGGPILDPQLDAVVLVPICPHTLSNRPIALRANSVIEFDVTDIEQADAHVSADGQRLCDLRSNEVIRISRSQHSLKLIKMTESDHYETLREKLRWG